MNNHNSFSDQPGRIMRFWSLLLGGLLLAGTLAHPGFVQAAEILKNSTVIELQKLGIGDAAVVEKIKGSTCDFDVTVSGLKALKDAQISNTIIEAMITAASKGNLPPAKAAPAAASGDPNDPASPHESGIYFFQKANGQNKLIRVESSIFTHTAMGSGWGAAFGGSMAMRGVINGSEAALQIPERRPVFYFYLGETQAGLSGASNPNEFVLAKLEIKKNKNRSERLLITGKVSAYGGSTMGIDPKAARPIESERIASGIFKVTPKEDLVDGEYGFCQAGAAPASGTGGKIFGFGINAK